MTPAVVASGWWVLGFAFCCGVQRWLGWPHSEQAQKGIVSGAHRFVNVAILRFDHGSRFLPIKEWKSLNSAAGCESI